MKNKQNSLGEETSDQNVILFMFYLESISMLPGSGSKAKACFRRLVISSKLDGWGWLVAYGHGKVCAETFEKPIYKISVRELPSCFWKEMLLRNVELVTSHPEKLNQKSDMRHLPFSCFRLKWITK